VISAEVSAPPTDGSYERDGRETGHKAGQRGWDIRGTSTLPGVGAVASAQVISRALAAGVMA